MVCSRCLLQRPQELQGEKSPSFLAVFHKGTPPSGRSWEITITFIYPISTNKVLLESFGQAEFNAPMSSFCAMMDIPPSWFMSKTFKMLLLSHILSNHLETWYTWSSGHAWYKTMKNVSNSKPFGRYSQPNLPAKPPNRKSANFSAALWHDCLSLSPRDPTPDKRMTMRTYHNQT